MAIPNKKNIVKDFNNFRKEIFKDKWLKQNRPDYLSASLKKLNKSKFANHVLKKKPNGQIIVQPRGGLPNFKLQKKLSITLSKYGADFIPLTVDSLTRHNEYEKALKESRRSNSNSFYLNGYPLVSLGAKKTKEIYKNIRKPISLRHGTPDAKVLVETALLSGITEIEGGALTYLLPYARDYPLDKALFNWQYVDRLCAVASRRGRLINRESFGPLTATMVPPFMVITIQLIELLLSAEQGVKSFSLSYGQMGSEIQDISSANVLRELSKYYLNKFNFKVDTFIVYHQWMGAFPYEKNKAIKLIKSSSQIAKKSKVDKIITKTFDEAYGIPSITNNAKCVAIVQEELKQKIEISNELKKNVTLEVKILKKQVKFLMKKIFQINKQTFWETVYEAVRIGYLDVPYSTHLDNKNKMLTIRDNQNSIRVYDSGSVPLTKEFKNYERKKINTVGKKFKLHEKIIKDIMLMI